MTQKYTALPALPFIFRHWGDTYAVVGVSERTGNTSMIALSDNSCEKAGHVYEESVPARQVLQYLNDGAYTLISPAPQEVVPETPVAKATMFDPLVIRVDTTEAERALSVLTELEASVTRVKALFA